MIRSLIYNLCGVLRLTSAGQTRQISQGPFYNWVFSSQCILVYTKISTIHPNVLYVFVFQIFPATFPSIPWTSVPGRSTKMRQREFTRTRLLLSRHTWQRKWWYEGGREEERIFTSSTVILTYSCNQFKPVVFSLPLSQLTPADGSSLSDYSSEPALYFWSNGPIRRPDPSPACTCTLPHL